MFDAKAKVFAKATPFLLFCAFSLALGETVYGYDVSSFGGVQAIPGFKKHFGTLQPNGKYTVSTTHTALLNSLASVGTVTGRLGAGPLVERIGHRRTLFLMVLINYVGAIIEITSNSVAQFIVGRIVLYTAVGLVSVAVPTYQSELVPAGMRAFTVASLQFFLVCGGLIATGVNKAYSKGEGNAAWRVPVGFTFLFPTIVLCTLPFLPDAPRWLLFKDRHADAVKTLKRVRPQSDVDTGMCELEIEAIEESLAAARVKLPWTALFQGTNRRRFLIAVGAFVFQQLGGQAFTSQYSTLFYQSVGLGEKAFTYPLVTTGLSLIAVASGMYCLDRFGRRPVYIFGGLSQGFWIFLVAGLGGRKSPTQADINGVVASVILYSLSFSFGWAPAPYGTAAEISSNELREKSMALSSAIGSFSAWLVSFTLPYLMNDSGAGLGPKVGYIYGAMCVLSVAVAYFFFPETKGRALEELDELFDKKVPAWKFASTETTGAGRRVAGIERDEVITEDKIEMSVKAQAEMQEA